MSKSGRVVLTLLRLAGFAVALYFALRGQKVEQAERVEAGAVASTVELTGLSALDVGPSSPIRGVHRSLAKRLPAAVTRAGSREMAGAEPARGRRHGAGLRADATRSNRAGAG